MAATTCPACRQFLRVLKPPEHMPDLPDRLPFHRIRPSGPICPGAGRSLPLHAEKPQEAS